MAIREEIVNGQLRVFAHVVSIDGQKYVTVEDAVAAIKLARQQERNAVSLVLKMRQASDERLK